MSFSWTISRKSSTPFLPSAWEGCIFLSIMDGTVARTHGQFNSQLGVELHNPKPPGLQIESRTSPACLILAVVMQWSRALAQLSPLLSLTPVLRVRALMVVLLLNWKTLPPELPCLPPQARIYWRCAMNMTLWLNSSTSWSPFVHLPSFNHYENIFFG